MHRIAIGELTTLKKYNTKSRITFNTEISSNLKELDNTNTHISRTEIKTDNNPTSFNEE